MNKAQKIITIIILVFFLLGIASAVFLDQSQFSQFLSAKVKITESTTSAAIDPAKIEEQERLEAEAAAKEKAEAEAKAKAEAEAKEKAEAEAKAKAEAEAKAKAEAEAKAKAEAEAKAKAEAEAKAKAEAEAKAKAEAEARLKAEEEERLQAEQEALALQNTSAPNATEARVQYINKYNRHVSDEDARRIVEICEEFASERTYLDADILLGMARLESTFRSETISASGKYVGLMQVSKYYGGLAGYTEDQLLDPYYNVQYACELLDDLAKKLSGDLKGILQAYNMGYYGYKAKVDAGEELSYSFYNNVMKYANQIKEMY